MKGLNLLSLHAQGSQPHSTFASECTSILNQSSSQLSRLIFCGIYVSCLRDEL